MYAHTENLRKLTTELESAITNAVLECVKNEKCVAIPFSGGIDSSIIASLASRNTEVMLYSVGTHNAHDLRMAESASKLLGLELTKIEINKRDVKEAIRQIVGFASFTNVVEISFGLPLYFVAKKSNEHILISGQGADELFGGYARYLAMEKLKLNEFLQKDVERVLVRALEEKKIANNFKKELHAPFLSPTVVSVAMGIPVEYKIYNGIRKYILREVGRSLGISEEIMTREKKAAQYGSGVMNAIKKLAREKGMNASQYVLSISKSKIENREKEVL